VRSELETWVFDVDGCLIDSLTGSSLRPGAKQLLEDLRRRGHRTVLWSAGGAAYARAHAQTQQIEALFDEFAGKNRRDDTGRYVPAFGAGDGAHAVYIDDRPEDLPVGADVIAVRPYLVDNVHDRGLAAAKERAATGS
jgi:long-chain acyl-CoA synthetase